LTILLLVVVAEAALHMVVVAAQVDLEQVLHLLSQQVIHTRLLLALVVLLAQVDHNQYSPQLLLQVAVAGVDQVKVVVLVVAVATTIILAVQVIRLLYHHRKEIMVDLIAVLVMVLVVAAVAQVR
jgi:hypothetical protein